jgi:opacity protein-like surface antigen
MKLRYLATVVALALTTVAAFAQTHDAPAQGNVGLYFNPIAIRASNSYADSGPYAFLGQNSTSQVFYGYDLGGFYDFFHSGSLATGFDMRFSDLHANNAMLKQFMVGLRVSGHPFVRPFKPYVQVSVGNGTTKAPYSTIRASKLGYGVFAGVDYTLARHVDFRAIEIGYGSLTTVGTGNVGNGGTVAEPAATLISFSSGLVFRF